MESGGGGVGRGIGKRDSAADERRRGRESPVLPVSNIICVLNRSFAEALFFLEGEPKITSLANPPPLPLWLGGSKSPYLFYGEASFGGGGGGGGLCCHTLTPPFFSRAPFAVFLD